VNFKVDIVERLERPKKLGNALDFEIRLCVGHDRSSKAAESAGRNRPAELEGYLD
jgi:hypothetical protein